MSRRKILREYEQHFAELQAAAKTPFERVSSIEPGCGPGASDHPKPGVYLNNPEMDAPIDRGQIQNPRMRQNGFGFELRPGNVNDVAVGDSAPGVSYFRRAQFFVNTGRIGGTNLQAASLQYDIPVAIATARSMDTRPRFWHISFFGISVDRFLSGEGGPPLNEYEIATQGNRFPTSTVLKGRIQVHDESGSRFFDLNIHGTASMSFYGFGATTYILLPSAVIDGERVALGYEVDAQNPAGIDFAGAVEDTLATGRILGLTQNDTKLTDFVTRSVSVPSGEFRSIRIPPGARTVRLQTTTRHPPGFVTDADYGIYFQTERGDRGAAVILGRIELLPGQFNTPTLEVPNATYIAFDDNQDLGDVDWVAVFEVEV